MSRTVARRPVTQPDSPRVTPAQWLQVVGINEDGLAGLGAEARRCVDAADVLIGGERHLTMVEDDPDRAARPRMTWPSPLADIVPLLEELRGQNVCVLATGDPFCFGVATALARWFAFDEMHVVPAPSAFALACARLGWSQPDVELITLHGRPLELVHPRVQPGARWLVLCNDGRTPMQVAELLGQRGYGSSRLIAMSHMGGPHETRLEGAAQDWPHARVDDFCTLAVECVHDPGTLLLPTVPGLPDTAYVHDGQLTKRAVRAATLAMLAPVPGQRLWDVGAGCGSIGIEWMRSSRGARAIAVEHNAERLSMIERNASALGTPGLEIVAGRAPQALVGLAPPDAVFVGGGTSDPELLPACLAALSTGGRLVANAVTLEGENALSTWHAREGGELSRHAVSHAEAVGPFRGLRPAMAVTQWSYTKR